MRATKRAVVSGLIILGVQTVILAYAAKTVQVPSPQQLAIQSGIAMWPWMPGGIQWVHASFGAIPYSIAVKQDASLPQGQTAVVEPGTEGTVLNYGNNRITVTPASPASIEKGTAVVHSLTVNGVTYHYDRVTSMMTTAYNASLSMNGPSGAVAAWNGQPLVNGDVAVDPTVIPFGTYLYIDGYGPARAVDTGSAIIGDHIDLFFNESAVKVALYGIQFHKVYVLTGRPKNFPS